MRLKAESSKVTGALKQLESTIEHLKKHPTERWQTIRQITKQLNSSHHVPSSKSVHSHPASPAWTQRMESLFGPINDQLRLIKCDNCGILTKENNSKVGVTHKLNCEILRKSSGSKRIFRSITRYQPIKEKEEDDNNRSYDIIGRTSGRTERDQWGADDQKQIKKALAAAERLERENERKEKKRIEEEARKAKKLSRAKGGPVNVNEQCGVLLPPNDTPCARSLTCKTHSMGAKRSVPGRSAPYDVLLNEWQKKNNPIGVIGRWSLLELAQNQSSGNSTQGQVVNNLRLPIQRNHQVKPSQTQEEEEEEGLKEEGQTSTSSTKLSAANEAKLLGELDADFYLIVPPPKKSSSSSSKLQQKSTPIDVDGDTVMGGEPPDHHPHQLDSEGEEDRSDNESDSEFEAVLKGLIISQNFLRKPCSFSSSSSSAVNCWSKFSKLGVRESFANSFKM
ncbi:hypothetical protein KEM48_013365 [Puccinia striiformis f. sp. tritici PST-130]|nr:hypothetical protein KEM48_013365 [Puccinia striiformis f. sp. tritici PST-130]